MNTGHNITREQAREALWRAGQLRFLLDKNQQEIYDAFYACTSRKFIVAASRRIGKSFTLVLLAIETALRIPGASVKFAAPTKTQAEDIVDDLFVPLLQECPEDLKPEYFAQKKRYDFPNGSSIVVAAMDSGRVDSIRGTSAHIGIIDEAAFTTSDNLEEMAQSVMMPMLLLTGGKLIIASTPPKTPNHTFERYFKAGLVTGSSIRRTIYDNPRLTPDIIEEFKQEAGGETSTTFLREYMSEFVVDTEIITFPEWNSEAQRTLVVESQRPPYFDCYTTIDLGLRDATGILFVYYDFKSAKVVVEDEALLSGVKEVRSDLIADIIKSKEEALWGENKTPYFRISDSDLGSQLMVNELEVHHGISFVVGEKDGKEAGVNELRLMIKNGLLNINPRCVKLIAQLGSCIWNSKRDGFDRIHGFFHFDLVDCLILAIRNIRRQHNPYPADRYSSNSQFFFDQPYEKSANAKLLESLFKVKKPE